MDPESVVEKLQIIKEGTIRTNESQLHCALKIELKQHQISMIHAMKKMEASSIPLGDDMHVDTNVGVCGDDVGTGKSLSILGLISENKKIKQRTHYEVTTNYFTVYQSTRREPMKINVIVVPHSIVKQWERYIETQTYLSFYVVTKKVHVKCVSDLQVKPDVVLVSSSMYNAFANCNMRVYFKRVVFDEADTIRIPACRPMQAQFIWLLTSSLENILFPNGYYYVYSQHYPRIVRKNVLGLKRNGFINDIARTIAFSSLPILRRLILKNDPVFAKESLGIQPPIKNYILCKTPVYMRIVTQGVQDQVLNYLNMGDVEAALQHLGCKRATMDQLIPAITQDIRERLEDVSAEIRFIESLNRQRESRLKDLIEKRRRLNERMQAIYEDLDNHEDKTCPLCWDEFQHPTCTLGCCNKMFCLSCILKCKSVCPLCRSVITKESITVVNDNEAKQEADDKKSKIDNLKDILSQNTTGNGKFLVFSNSDATFDKLSDVITKMGVSHSKLYGNAGAIENRIKSFNAGKTQVLLLNPQHYGCGLNLEHTTDIIFFHRFESDMERQIIGRAQRHGRTSVLRVHYLFYENEFQRT
jgi:SNF2 family DNA or RNA helicase